jgi:hypothetical protein
LSIMAAMRQRSNSRDLKNCIFALRQVPTPTW